MSTATIEIIEGCTERSSRLGLKKAMQVYGEIDACHMGDRAVMGDNFTEYPLVRFKSQTAADNAYQALKAGQVFLDGVPLKGEWRGGTRRPQVKEKDVPEKTRSEDDPGSIGSRVLGKEANVKVRARSASRGRRKRSRSRSRRRRSPGKKENQKPEVNLMTALLGLPESKEAGNAEGDVSENPLFKSK
eukprot:TRINITY_DN101962_c0_g1_i1.p1 TRINITY_DN101962_c0_g1~~TRINITY_DN101962_c0_g1_i1.p1  ORF type:complete len:188 (+),score=42.06 TRINITY_DN101962_c0_g1_i1:51-614(+)